MIIWSVSVFVDKNAEKSVVIYENEIRCKSCGSTDMISDYAGLSAAALRKVVEPDYDEITLARNNVIMENKSMPFSEARPHIERRIQEEPRNGELRLRHANHLRKLNEYEEAIKEYEESLRLNENLIASLVNLCDIYLYRHKEYKEKGALEKARDYFEKMVSLYRSDKAVFTTIEDTKTIPIWIKDRKTLLYPKKKRR